MQHAAWRGVWRAAFHGEIRSMLERFSFSSVVSAINLDANSRSATPDVRADCFGQC